jgi:hypothetical protein
MFNFETLDVWQEAIQFADLVYHVHRKERDNERQHCVPRTERQRNEQEQINHRRDSHENDLEKPDAGQTEPAERAIIPVEHHVAMFPETLQRAIGPSRTLSRQRGHRLGRFGPRDRLGHVDDALTAFM